MRFENISAPPRIDLQDAGSGVEVEYINCIFPVGLNISGMKIDGRLRFVRCVFHGDCRAEDLTLGGQLVLDGCQFYGDVHFGGSTFSSPCMIVDCDFQRYASFRECTFVESVWFSKTRFFGYFSQIGVTMLKEAFYDSTTFARVNTFDRSIFQRTASFSACSFLRAPTFFEVAISEDIKMSACRFTDLLSEDAYPAYRTLKSIFSTQNARRSEAFFYVLEQKSLTRSLEGSFEYWLSMAYEWSCQYGTSISRSLGFFALVNGFFLILYAIYFGVVNSPFYFTASQIFAPFEIWKLPSAEQLGGVKILASVQSVLNFVGLGFFWLSLGWRFKNQ